MFTSDLNQVSKILRTGGIAIFPTDTVWGMGCCAKSDQAIAKFYQIKQREASKPTAILVNSLQMAQEYGELTVQALSLAEKHWPGALTIIVKAKSSVPRAIAGENGTVGLRFPDFTVTQQLIAQLSCGLVTGSANFAGEPSPGEKEKLNPELLKKVDIVLDGECGHQPPSTVADCSGGDFKVLRQGLVSL